jgi:YVTN family beta-propeller protein
MLVLSLSVRPVFAQSAVYVVNLGSDDISVIDAVTNTVTATIPVGTDPDGIAATPDGRRLYVTNFLSNEVSVIDAVVNQVSSTVPVGSGPVGVAVTADGTRAYVANRGADQVSVIDTTNEEVVATIEVSRGPNAVAITPDGKHAYVTNSFTRNPGMVSVIDTDVGVVAATVPVNRNPNRVAVTPDGRMAYVTNFRSWNVTVVDTVTNEVVTAMRVRGRPSGVAVNPNGAFAYVTTLDGLVNVIDIPANRVGAIFQAGGQPYGVAIAGNGGTAYVADFASNNVSVLDLVHETTTGDIAVGDRPFAVAITCTGNLCSEPPFTPWPRPTATATATRTSTGTPTSTAPPRPTTTPRPTAMPTSTGMPVPTATPISTRVVRLRIGSAAGRPGERVTVEVVLDSDGLSVAGVQNDIVFDPALADLDKASSCTINPEIGDQLDGCEADPPVGPCKFLLRNLADCPEALGCPPDSAGLRRFRGIVLATSNVNEIPDGLLYTCSFAISANATAGAHARLTCSYPGVSDPQGSPHDTVCADGEIQVLPAVPIEAPSIESPLDSGGLNVGRSASSEAVFLCSAGERDGLPCDGSEACPQGVCVIPQGVCDGGEDDGLLCDCPGGSCSLDVACPADPSRGLCRGGSTDGTCCSPASNCGSRAPCVGTQKLCVGGVAKGLPCLDDDQCFDSACHATGRLCQGGDFDGVGCVDDRDCPLGACVDLQATPTATFTVATPTSPAVGTGHSSGGSCTISRPAAAGPGWILLLVPLLAWPWRRFGAPLRLHLRGLHQSRFRIAGSSGPASVGPAPALHNPSRLRSSATSGRKIGSGICSPRHSNSASSASRRSRPRGV